MATTTAVTETVQQSNTDENVQHNLFKFLWCLYKVCTGFFRSPLFSRLLLLLPIPWMLLCGVRKSHSCRCFWLCVCVLVIALLCVRFSVCARNSPTTPRALDKRHTIRQLRLQHLQLRPESEMETHSSVWQTRCREIGLVGICCNRLCVNCVCFWRKKLPHSTAVIGFQLRKVMRTLWNGKEGLWNKLRTLHTRNAPKRFPNDLAMHLASLKPTNPMANARMPPNRIAFGECACVNVHGMHGTDMWLFVHCWHCRRRDR